jgi:plastocyanin
MQRLALAGLLLALGLAGCGDDEGSSGGQQGTIDVRLSEFALDPARISVDEPGTYVFRAVNDGRAVHALEVEGHGVEAETGEIQPGETAELTVELTEAGEYELYCPVGGHRDQGMDGSVTVGGSAAGAGGGTTTTTEDEHEDEDEDDGYGTG